MDSSDQVIFVLQLVVALGPLAVYFLALGLVNSQPRPTLVSARSDFVILAIAFAPVLIGPMVGMIGRGWWPVAVGVLLFAAGLFAMLLPPRRRSWVVYNIDREQFERVFQRACRRCGWSVQTDEDGIRVLPTGYRVHLRGLALLRNVSFELETPSSGSEAADPDRLIPALNCELGREMLLPSATGASLVVVGATLLGVPMWYVVRHIDVIVDVVRQILHA